LYHGIRHQRDTLAKAGCERVFIDKASGTRSDRRGLARALSHVHPGDTLVVWKLDRLGRTVRGLIDLVGDLRERGVQFRSLTDSIDTGTPAGRTLINSDLWACASAQPPSTQTFPNVARLSGAQAPGPT
jgi:DNA invertase Pin-like site-specific DNA recombinase